MNATKGLRVAMLSLHSCPLDVPGRRDTGGMNVYVQQLARGLGDRGVKVDIFTTAHDTAGEEVPWPGRNVRLIHLPITRRDDKLDLLPLLPEAAVAIDRLAREQGLNYDLIHSHYWISGLVGVQLAREWEVPHISMLHTSARAKNLYLPGRGESDLRVRAEDNILRSADAVVASTLGEHLDLVRLYGVDGDKLLRVPCGVDLERFRPHPRDQARRSLALDARPLILYVGRIERGKGIDLLLEAMAKSAQKSSRLLVVGGDRSEEEELSRLRGIIQRLGLKGRVVLCGAVLQKRLPLYYSAADVLVLPSRYETFGMVVLEALACGTPVIGSRVGIMETVITPGVNGLLLDKLSPENIARAFETVLRDEALKQKMSAAARDSVLDYAWQRVTGDILRVYRAVLGSRKDQGYQVTSNK